ncbi:MAG: hypothetical protein K0S25_12 [Bacillus sp. (in: firmicutes)]|jgi:hypothetical protein|nr:hypothetical protein [Bacillus sp. (in: firmicutes)]
MKALLEKFLKGESTIDDVLAAIDNDKKDYVPRARLNDKNVEIKDLKDEIKNRDDQITELQKATKGNEELEKKLKTLEKANGDWETKFKQTQIDTAIKLAAKDAKDPADVLAFIKKEGLELNEDGTIKGLDDALKGLRESKPYLFGEKPGLNGRQPNNPPGTHQTVKNPFSTEHFNLTEQARLFKEDPELYKQLKAQA